MLILNLRGSGFQHSDATRYVIGQYDGNKFVAFGEEMSITRYLDYGADFTAMSTFFDFGLNPSQRIGIAWMSSSRYFSDLPTESFRGQLSVPRDLILRDYNRKLYVFSRPNYE